MRKQGPLLLESPHTELMDLQLSDKNSLDRFGV